MKPFLTLAFLSFLVQAFAQIPIIEAEGIKTTVNSQKDSIYIQGLENSIGINFPKNNQAIEYQLVGFDKKTIKNIYPSIRYTNLPGGIFQLKYKLADQANYSYITIEVMEALWQKWWFWPMIAGYILLLVGVGTYLFFLYNFRQKLKLEYLRNRIATDLHDEVGSNLSSIAIFTEVLKKKLNSDHSDLLPILDKITNNSKESVGLMQDTVWAINPTNDSTQKLIERILVFGKEILTSQNISFSHKISVDITKIELDMEKRKNCYMIVKEAINNIAKHSEATHASFEIIKEGDKILFKIEDDGIGFDLNELTDGNGLNNFKNRAAESDFEAFIQSKQGFGTSIKLYIS